MMVMTNKFSYLKRSVKLPRIALRIDLEQGVV
jgi:hypothetical protein